MNKMFRAIVCLTVVALCGYPAISKASDTIQAYLFPSKLHINGLSINLPTEYDIINYKEHAYVPVRFITEYLNGSVKYDEKTQNIALNFNSFGHLEKNYSKEMAEKNQDIIYHSSTKIENLEMFYNFLNKNSKADWIRITYFTIEGGAIIQELRRVGDKIEYFYDASRDEYGEHIQYITTGTSISEIKLNEAGLYEYRLEGASFPKNEETILLRVQK